MKLTFGNNINTGILLGNLQKSANELTSVYERLSSGQRINNASDNPADLAVVENLNSDVNVFNQGLRNVNNAMSAFNVAEGAIQELQNILQRQLELAEQAANGTYTSQQRISLHTEANALVDEYNRIIESTSFNSIQLLDGSTSSLQVQAAYSSINFELGSNLSGQVGDGTFTQDSLISSFGSSPRDLTTGDFNGDGITDLIAGMAFSDKIGIVLGNGDGTFGAVTTFATGDFPSGIAVADIDGDGALDVVTSDRNTDTVSVLLGNGDGTFGTVTSYSANDINTSDEIMLGDVTGDGNLDIVSVAHNSGVINIFNGNGDGTFQAATSIATGEAISVALGDLNGDSVLDIVVGDNDALDDTITVYLAEGGGAFSSGQSYTTSGLEATDVTLVDYNGDGYLDASSISATGQMISVWLGNGDGSFGTVTTYSTGGNVGFAEFSQSVDLNGDGAPDIVTSLRSATVFNVFLGNGDGTFQNVVSYSLTNNSNHLAFGDFDQNGTIDIAAASEGSDTIEIFTGDPKETSRMARIDLSTQAQARIALTTIDEMLTKVNKEFGSIGATQSRLSFTSQHLTDIKANFEAAKNTIISTDIAEDSALLLALQIKQKATTALLAQANQSGTLVLSLLQ